MQNVGLILLVFAFVFAVIAACFVQTLAPRWHFGWAAVTFWIASELFAGLGHVFH